MSGQDVCPSRPPTEAASAARGAGSFGVWGAVRAPYPSTRPASPGTSGPCLCSEAFLKAPSDRASSGTAADGRRKDGEGKSDQRGHADDMTFVPEMRGLAEMHYYAAEFFGFFFNRLIPFLLGKVFHDIKGFVCLLICFRLRRQWEGGGRRGECAFPTPEGDLQETPCSADAQARTSYRCHLKLRVLSTA